MFKGTLETHMHNSIELWSLELACLEHQGLLELVRRSRQFPYTFNVKIHPRLEQRWLKLSKSKHSPQSDFFMLEHYNGSNQIFLYMNQSHA